MTWANMSPPMVLVPKGWDREGGAFRVLVIVRVAVVSRTAR